MSDYKTGFSLELKKMDVYLEKELTEKTGRIAILMLILLLPNFFVKEFAILFLSSSLLIHDIRHQNVEILYSLPFSKKELFSFNLIFLCLAVFITSAFGEIFIDNTIVEKLEFILRSLILIFSIFGIQVILSEFNIDAVVFSFIAVIFDAILGNFGTPDINSSNFNPYSLISFTKQGNLVMSLVFSILICFISYLVYTRKDGENPHEGFGSNKLKQTD
ncbi:hypothetical protein [Thermoanaerobacterium sp. R66]|jgi:hypothetical protein|uniref:hypothetical protein n=1 Tax=Thermoanaerobacterium sp. R66 TaxID=2742479 RepID=UPI002380A9D1|nr:hypothetical protein [Thermoanaerobacterium sp. R66]MDE4542377.1 hypothetical protein [Thermoanaerobacterium sp. R66]